MPVQKIRPFLWYNDSAEVAAAFYVTLFKDSKILRTMPGPEKPMGVEFALEGRDYVGFNGGPHYQLNAACSLYVDCADQKEVDRLWDAFLSSGGKPTRCGWLVDNWGLSWQIIPEALPRLMNDKDRARAGRVVQAMMQMEKIVVTDLERAYDGN
jgi:predicted 3-demethylubiquinone-9 3-methyltransferase (glyoxalase superfamily)